MSREKAARKRIAFIGAGSLGFTKKIVTDVLSYPALSDSVLAFMDIDETRLGYAVRTVRRVVREGKYKAKVEAWRDRKSALKDADYVFITILVDGYEGFRPEIEIPMKYGVNQAVGDTTGPGGVFRAQRTIPVMLDIARDVERYAKPGVLILNYTNPMHMLSWAVTEATPVSYVGLCHSVQGTTDFLARVLGVPYDEVRYWVAGINHQAWVLEFEHEGKSLIPDIRKKADTPEFYRDAPVRCEMCRQLGYFVTESSSHNSEYVPWIRKRPEILAKYLPGGLNDYGMLLTEYGQRRDHWKAWMKDLASGKTPMDLNRSHEYGAAIINAIETNIPFRFNGNVRNTGLITNLPEGCCVEVPCVAEGSGVRPLYVGDLPLQLAALNRMNVSVHELSVLAARHKDPEMIFQALAYDPLTASVLSLQQIRDMTAEMLNAQKKLLPGYNIRRFDKKGEMKGFGKDYLVETLGKDKAELFRELNVIDRFHILGPFENADSSGNSLGLKKVLEPERRVDLKSTFKGKGGKRIRWKKITARHFDDDGFVNLRVACAPVEMVVAYAYTILEAIADAHVDIQIGSDDGIAIWLNRKEIYRKDAHRCAVRGQTTIPLSLRHGKNELLFKIDQRQGEWGFYANFALRYPNVSVRLA